MTPNRSLLIAVISCSQSVVPCIFDVVGIFFGWMLGGKVFWVGDRQEDFWVDNRSEGF